MTNDSPDNAPVAALAQPPALNYLARAESGPPRQRGWEVASLAIGVANPLGYLLVSKVLPGLWPMPREVLAGLAVAMLGVPAFGFWCAVMATRGPRRAGPVAAIGFVINGAYLVVATASAVLMLLLL
jgi:hypothetical protein